MKTIAIIGATGNMGTGISTALAKANYSLHLYAPDREALVTHAGFRPLVAGKLQNNGVLEQMTLLLIGLSQRYEYNWHASWKVLG